MVPPPSDRRTSVRFLVNRVDGSHGVARAVLNLSGYLADHYDVEIVSLFRRRDKPTYAAPPGVRVTYVEDRRKGSMEQGLVRRMLSKGRSRLVAEDRPINPTPTLLTDVRLLRALWTQRQGILVTTRPELHVVAARRAPRGLLLIAQDHLNYLGRSELRRREMRAVADRIDALVTLTRGDAEDYRSLSNWPEQSLLSIPNSMPWQVGDPGRVRRKVVLAAGRLDPQKGFDQLIAAYEPVACKHPDWRLHIYGKGTQRAELLAMVKERGLADQVKLKGWSARFHDVLADASVFALSSRYEGMPLVMVEAMSVGLPLVSFDCPRGPAELVRDGLNGFLVPDGDIEGFASALLRVVEDDGLRERLGRQALADARNYDMSVIGRRWRDLFEKLLSERAVRRPRRRGWTPRLRRAGRR